MPDVSGRTRGDGKTRGAAIRRRDEDKERGCGRSDLSLRELTCAAALRGGGICEAMAGC